MMKDQNDRVLLGAGSKLKATGTDLRNPIFSCSFHPTSVQDIEVISR